MAEEVHDNPADWVAKQIRTIVESGGEKGNRFYGHDVLLLTTRGRRSGRLRRTALWFFEDGDRYLLGRPNGTRGGRPNDLRSSPSGNTEPSWIAYTFGR
ncbi:MAG: nitroreductase/quinone reductase family protein [Thermoleophilaceae bacterium]